MGKSSGKEREDAENERRKEEEEEEEGERQLATKRVNEHCASDERTYERTKRTNGKNEPNCYCAVAAVAVQEFS